MPRELVRRAVPAQRGESLPAAYWPQLEGVRLSGSPDRIDLVLVGPSGVQVVVDRPHPAGPGVRAGATDLEDAARRAASAATGVALLLPGRYQHAVHAAVRLVGDSEVAMTVAEVEAASPDVLQHMWRQRPRVLSTSEVAVVSGLLRGRLEPCPAASPKPNRWWRRSWLRCLAAGSAASAAAAGAALAWGWSPWGAL